MAVEGLAEEIKSIYQSAREIYERSRKGLGSKAMGFRILYGPVPNPCRSIFVGCQPGGDVNDHRQSEHLSPPAKNELLTEDWRLASELRRVFGEQCLRGAVMTNAVFWRSPKTENWRSVPEETRLAVEQFSGTCVQRLVKAIAPAQIVILGWDALRQLKQGSFRETLAGNTSRPGGGRTRLLQVGMLFGFPAFAIPHPSAWWMNPPVRQTDLDAIRERVFGTDL